ncbi:uncharacterized protein LOC135834665 [Planococcus citri]|uniref:uncharacterized protein LOC135834665 n=1 Tax=Planococcus citri TaxID=170843 RepID=UPI0031F7ECEB
MPQLNKILYKCNLQTGTLLLLWLFVIICGSGLVIDIYHMSEGSQPWPEDLTWINFKFITAFIYKLGVFTVAIVGLYGIHRNKPQFFTLFYYFNYFQLLLISVFIVYLFVDPVEHSKEFIPVNRLAIEDHNRTIVLSLLLLFGLGFQIYFTVVVKSYYEEMKDRSSSKTHILIFSYPDHYYDYGLAYVR